MVPLLPPPPRLLLQREESAALTDSVRGDVIKEMLPIVDNFELARTQVRGAGWGDFVRLTGKGGAGRGRGRGRAG